MSEEISIRLQKIRKMYGLSQRELAKRAGVTNSSVSMIEQGRVSPSLSSLEKLLNAIPMNLRDFFTIDFNHNSNCFFRNYQMLLSSNDLIDCYHLAESKDDKRSQLRYEVYAPGADTGETMLVNPVRSSGFVVQGFLDVVINGHMETLEAGDGFIIEAGYLHRLRNLSDAKAIVIINRVPLM